MKFIETYSNWETTPKNVGWDYTSKDKIYYGIHIVKLTRNGKSVDVKAKFDTGARSSSIDFSVGEKLGISKELISECEKLENIEVPKTITKKEMKALEKKYTTEYKLKFPDITSIQVSKSSSGFSLRAYIRLSINYASNNIDTEVNLRDRSGLSCEMLVGLSDMI